jgi:hypothetical protein
MLELLLLYLVGSLDLLETKMEDAGFVVIVVVVPLSQVCLSGRRRRRRRARRRMHDHVFVVSSLSSRKKEEECRKFCFSFVASWSLLVVSLLFLRKEW